MNYMHKKIDTMSTTIINILKQPKDSCLLSTSDFKIRAHTCTQTAQQTVIPSQCRVRERVRRMEKVELQLEESGCGGTDWEGQEDGVQRGQRPQG